MKSRRGKGFVGEGVCGGGGAWFALDRKNTTMRSGKLKQIKTLSNTLLPFDYFTLTSDVVQMK